MNSLISFGFERAVYYIKDISEQKPLDYIQILTIIVIVDTR